MNKKIILIFSFLIVYRSFAAQGGTNSPKRLFLKTEHDVKADKDDSSNSASISPRRFALSPKSNAHTALQKPGLNAILLNAILEVDPDGIVRMVMKYKLPPQRYPNHAPISDILSGFPTQYSPSYAHKYNEAKPPRRCCTWCILS